MLCQAFISFDKANKLSLHLAWFLRKVKPIIKFLLSFCIFHVIFKGIAKRIILNTMTNLQNKIRELMAQKDINAVKIEKNTGLNRNTVYSILAGNSKTPSAQNLQLIAKALGVSLEFLLLDVEKIMTDNLTAEQIKIFCDATNSITTSIIEKKINISLEKLVALIKEVYQYSIETQAESPHIDDKFLRWTIDKYHKF